MLMLLEFILKQFNLSHVSFSVNRSANVMPQFSLGSKIASFSLVSRYLHHFVKMLVSLIPLLFTQSLKARFFVTFKYQLLCILTKFWQEKHQQFKKSML